MATVGKISATKGNHPVAPETVEANWTGGNEASGETAAWPMSDVVADTSSSTLLVAKAVRQKLKNESITMQFAADALPALNAKVGDILYLAIARAIGNRRKTVKACDF